MLRYIKYHVYILRYIHTVGKICKAEQKSSERIKIIYFNSWRISLTFTMKKNHFNNSARKDGEIKIVVSKIC